MRQRGFFANNDDGSNKKCVPPFKVEVPELAPE